MTENSGVILPVHNIEKDGDWWPIRTSVPGTELRVDYARWDGEHWEFAYHYPDQADIMERTDKPPNLIDTNDK